jgi:pimeloyl-ACP methyl ester carboxylesterase
LLLAICAMAWLALSVRTRGDGDDRPADRPLVSVEDDGTVLSLLPTAPRGRPALIFICGSGAAAEAYAPLLRPIAEAGFPVFVVNLPYRFAPLESHRPIVFDRVRQVIAAHPDVENWIISGHSLGAALAARLAGAGSEPLSGMVLIATTHPQTEDLSQLQFPVTKIYATNDGLVAVDKVLANKGKLPDHTRWVEIRGGNHSQFGRYGNQFVDGDATISREQQEAVTRREIIRLLAEVEAGR